MKIFLALVGLHIGLCTAQDLRLPDLLLVDDPNIEKVPYHVGYVHWNAFHREDTLNLLRTHIYGRNPVDRPEDLNFKVVETNADALDGKATLKRIEISFSGPNGKGSFMLSLFVPNAAKKPVPCFLLICNRGYENIDHTRKEKSPFWPVERVIERGYAIAAFHNSELDPDEHDGFKNGVHGLFEPKDRPRPKDAWGTIAAWAWGASRVMDYFETDKDIDHHHVAVLGHSRGGKAALWCGAQDERFSLTISNNSGCTGAALARRKKGESIKKINDRFPHWFCDNYKAVNEKEDMLPVDQHQLIAMMAPRLVYVASATEDDWADPEGEFLACVHAKPAFQLFDLKGVGAKEMPKPDSPLHSGHIGYHLRTGKHNLVESDWDHYMDFADKHWRLREMKHALVDQMNRKLPDGWKARLIFGGAIMEIHSVGEVKVSDYHSSPFLGQEEAVDMRKHLIWYRLDELMKKGDYIKFQDRNSEVFVQEDKLRNIAIEKGVKFSKGQPYFEGRQAREAYLDYALEARELYDELYTTLPSRYYQELSLYELRPRGQSLVQGLAEDAEQLHEAIESLLKDHRDIIHE